MLKQNKTIPKELILDILSSMRLTLLPDEKINTKIEDLSKINFKKILENWCQHVKNFLGTSAIIYLYLGEAFKKKKMSEEGNILRVLELQARIDQQDATIAQQTARIAALESRDVLVGFLIEKSYFGFGEPKPDDETIKTFKVEFPSGQIIQLKERLKNSRIGHSDLEDVNDWSYGIKLNNLKDWSNYWEMNFDFNKSQERLNQFPHYLTQIEGIMIHFLHVKPPKHSSYKQIIPLILVHGWPGNVYEFYKIIPLLTDPKAHSLDFNFAFEVIAPSIPGYGFSEQPHKKGFDSIAAARIFNRLMTERLGFKKYLAQGGDWGSLIVSNIGRYYSSNLLAIHLNMAFVNPFDSFKHFILSFIGCYKPHWVFSEPEHFKNFSLKAKAMNFLQESGYMHIQATKPDTIGVGLNDSPIGLLAYILEKFSTWTNPSFRSLPDGGLLKKYSREDLLTIISIYWFKGNILSSQRFYKENLSAKNIDLSSKYVTVPTGYAAFPHDLGEVAPKELMKLNYNLTYMTMFQDGGHFAALELPEELAKDLFNFAKTI